MRILTTNEIRAAEQEAIGRPGGSALALMQAAGHAVTQFCTANFTFRSVCVVCGKGNNGGDGFVAAEALRSMGHEVTVIVLAKDASELSPDAGAMCSRLNLEPIWIREESGLDAETVHAALRAELVLDAIVGTGFKPPLRGFARRAVEAINSAFGTVVAIDLPSGINADNTTPAHYSEADAVFAHGIITFIAPKPAHVFGELTSGPIAVSEIGVSPTMTPDKTNLQVATGQEAGIAFPPRAKDAHKGEFGHVLVIAGSLGKAGAAGLAGMAALHTGAGLVTVAGPKSVQPTVAGFAPELMTEALEETTDGTISLRAERRVDQLLIGKDAVVLGPGLSTNSETVEFVRRLVARCPAPLVLDADGLNAFDGHYGELKSSAAPFRVLTPHPGEAARLLGVSTRDIQADRLEVARRIAHETGWCTVLKGARTAVAGASGETWINMSGNPALAKGGSGDVLSGMIGAALARKLPQPGLPAIAGGSDAAPPKSLMHEIHGRDSRDKARRFQQEQLQRNIGETSPLLKEVSVAAAVHLHGLAGDIARDALHENAVMARDVIERLGQAFRECEAQVGRGVFYLQK
jgi:NAD(P)H-hydrate epimerase